MGISRETIFWVLLILLFLISSAKATTFFNATPLQNFTLVYNVTFTNWKFQISGKNSSLALQPAVSIQGIKYTINATTPNINQFNQSIVNKITGYKFSFNVSVPTVVRTNVNNFSLDVVNNSGKVWFNNEVHELYMENIVVSFADLVAAGFSVTINSTSVVIGNIAGKTFNFDPSINFSSANINNIAMAPLNNSFVLAYCDDTANKHDFIIYNTNGTNVTPETVFDGTIAACKDGDISVTTLTTSNGGLWAYCEYEWNTDTINLQFFNSTGQNVTPFTKVATSINSYDAACSAVNSTDIEFLYHDTANSCINATTYHYNGAGLVPTLVYGPTIIDAPVGGSASYVTTSVTALLTSPPSYFACYASYTTTLLNCTVRQVDGTVITAPWTVDNAGQGLIAPITSCFNSTACTVIWNHRFAPQKVYAANYWTNGTQIGSTQTIEPTTDAKGVSAGTFNDTTTVYGDYNSTLVNAVVYSSSFVNQTPNVTISTTSNGYPVGIISRELASGITLCPSATVNIYLVYAWSNSSTQADFITLYSNLTTWDGSCPAGGAAAYPLYSSNSTNSTLAGMTILHSLYWYNSTVSEVLSGYIFSFYNGTDTTYNWTSTNQQGTTLQLIPTAGTPTTSAAHPPRYWDSTTKWANVSQVQVSDNSMAFATTQNNITNFYDFSYGISQPIVPLGAVINGINVSVEYSRGNGSVATTADVNISNDGGSTIKPMSNCALTRSSSTDTTTNCGDLHSLYGLTWTQAKVVATGQTGLDLYVKKTSVSWTNQFRIDFITLNINYTPAVAESNTSWNQYTGIGGSNYDTATLIKLNITIANYTPYASNTSNANNHRPDIEIGVWNGSAYVNGSLCGLNATMGAELQNDTAYNCTLSTTDAATLSAWATTSNRKIQIRGTWLDSYGGVNDEVNVSGVYAYVEAHSAVMVNDSWVPMSGTSNWSNVSKLVNSNSGVVIKWCVYANDTSNNWNSTSCVTPFNYTTTQAGGIQEYSRIAYDSITFADSNSRNITRVRTSSDYLTFIDSNARNTTLIRSFSDYLTFIDSSSRGLKFTRSASDYLTLIDSLTTSGQYSRSVVDYLTFQDSISRNASYYRSLTDYLVWADTTSRNFEFSRSAADYLIYMDTVTRVREVPRFASDYLTFSDWANSTIQVFLINIAYQNNSVVFTCNATSQSGNFTNVSLYLSPPSGWQINETQNATGITATANFTKLLSPGIYRWNCEWCTATNCSFALKNNSVIINLPSPTGGNLALNIGGELSMIGVIVTGLMVLVFVYLHVHQEDPAWKVGYLLLAMVMMSVTIVLAILDLSAPVITSSVYDPSTNTYNFTYGNVTDTSAQKAILTSLLNPINWVLYVVIAVVLVGVMVKIVEYATTKRR